MGCTALLLPPFGVCRAAVVAKARWKFLIPLDSYETKTPLSRPGRQKAPGPSQRPEKTWVPAGASGHELSRPKRVSWLPAYGMMSAMSIPVSCVGVKTHVFMNDLVAAHWTSDVESTAPLGVLLRHDLWTPFWCLISCKIRSIISVVCDFTTKSDGICSLLCSLLMLPHSQHR